MISDHDAVIFFFGLFWAAMTAGAARFRPFDSAAALQIGGPAARRFWSAMFWLNLAPLSYLWLALLWITNFNIQRGAVSIAIAALGIFGFYRIFAGRVLSNPNDFVDSWLADRFKKNHEGVERVEEHQAGTVRWHPLEAEGSSHTISGWGWVLAFPLLAVVVSLPWHRAVHLDPTASDWRSRAQTYSDAGRHRLTVGCPQGQRVAAGGYNYTIYFGELPATEGSHPAADKNRWQVDFILKVGSKSNVTVFASCVPNANQS